MDKLGIDGQVILAQLVNFGILLLILFKLIYKPVQKVLREGKEKIAESIKLSEKLVKDGENIEKRKKKVLAEADNQGRKMIVAAEKEADGIVAEAKEKTKEEAIKVKKDAEEKIEAQVKEVEKVLETKSIEMAVSLASRILKEAIGKNEEIDRKIVNQSINKLKNIKAD